jgi:hypothetical protein
MVYFWNTNVVIQFLNNLAVFWVKKPPNLFDNFFGDNIFKIITSVQGWKIIRLSNNDEKNMDFKSM